MTDELPGVWENARKMCAAGWKVHAIVLNEKRPIGEKWPEHGTTNDEGVCELAAHYPQNNYGMFRDDAAVIDIDLWKRESATLESELQQLYKVVGFFEPQFMQKTGNGGYHIPFYTNGQEIHSQPLTDISEIKGWHSQILGAGSTHPKTGRRYEIHQGSPDTLTELPGDALINLSRSTLEYEAAQVVMPDDDTEHPPCIRYLLERGAPASKSKKEITYNNANLLLVNYAIGRGYSDEQALWLAQEMAVHTDPAHPTMKNTGDKIANFRSALSTARRDTKKYQFACGYMRRSKSIKEDGCFEDCPNYLTRVKAVAPIPQVIVPPGEYSIEQLLKVNRKHLHIDEDYNVTVIPVVVISNRLDADVDVVIIVGPSGSLKTELIRELGETENQYIYPVSTITEHTFASGYVENDDLAPRLRGRTLVIKDFTSIMSMRDDALGLILADIREITDGKIEKEFGSGARKRHRGLHSSILAASTGAIEHYQSVFSKLGSRLLLVRPKNNSIEARRRSWQNQSSLKMKEIRKELNTEMFGFIDQEIQRLTAEPETYKKLPDEDAEQIGVWCDSLAVLRTHIMRDRYGNVVSEPEPEVPTRLQDTICKFTQVHASCTDAPRVRLTLSLRSD